MLLWLFDYLTHYYHAFQVFHYITLRAVLATMTALLFCLILGPWLITKLTLYQIGQPIRESGPKSHQKKMGTPTMGGALILMAISIAVLAWGDLSNYFLWLALLVSLAFGTIGWIDDRRKIILKNSKGLTARWKFLWQCLIALFAAVLLFTLTTHNEYSQLLLPFVKHVDLFLGWYFIPFACLVIVGSSNAVNLTDGLDGLAIMPTVLISAALGVFSYVTGNIEFSNYLSLPYLAGVGELTILCGALVGAGLGFLWFNAYPAQIFMGDVGSLGLGAALGMVAVLVRQELVFAIMGGIFVVETVSVILQVACFKVTGKRIFRMAPIHHHFELKGWAEPKVIVRFWIITVILVLFGLATLKIR